MDEHERAVSRESYLFQATEISRASYSMSLTERRLVYIAMLAVRPEDDRLPTVYVRVADVVRALGLPDEGGTYNSLRSACEGLRGHVISLSTPTGWKVFGWIDAAEYDRETGKIRMKLSDEIAPFVLHLKKSFSVLALHDIAKLQSKYALRLWELAVSYRGLAGSNGNPPGEWFVDLMFADLRKMLQIGPERYRATTDFRINVIDYPIREINEANLGLHIECDYQHFRYGRRLEGVRLRCRSLKTGDPRPVNPATETDREALTIDDRIAALSPAQRKVYERILAEELSQHDMFERATGPITFGEKIRPEAAKRNALAAAETVSRPKKTGKK